jgi:site-specific recombinase XerD
MKSLHSALTKTQRKSSSKGKITFPYATRSFIGYLEGTHKSTLTIKNYRLDIQAFQDFLVNRYSGKAIQIHQITRKDLDAYREHLKTEGFRINTRRRKILTVTQFMQYLARRKKMAPEIASKVPAPHKVERVPFTAPSRQLVQAIQSIPARTLLDLRNRCLLWSLAETVELRYHQWEKKAPNTAVLHITGKFSRTLPVSVELLTEIQTLQTKAGANLSAPVFIGFNKFGPLGGRPMTPRGVELLVKHYGPILGFPKLTPRTFRHSVILQWFEDGIPQSTVQSWLGLKTTYAFRSYVPLLKSSLETTSSGEKNPPESEMRPE